jgi:hypothetical protein
MPIAPAPITPTPITGIAGTPVDAADTSHALGNGRPAAEGREHQPVSSGSSRRSDGGDSWSADDDVAAEIEASVSFEPSALRERIAE